MNEICGRCRRNKKYDELWFECCPEHVSEFERLCGSCYLAFHPRVQQVSETSNSIMPAYYAAVQAVADDQIAEAEIELAEMDADGNELRLLITVRNEVRHFQVGDDSTDGD